jgi:hypothetical protein
MAPDYVGHQLLQIVLGGLKLRRLCVHFHLPIRCPPQEKARRQYPSMLEPIELATDAAQLVGTAISAMSAMRARSGR